MKNSPLLLLTLLVFGCAQPAAVDTRVGQPGKDGANEVRPEALVPLGSQEFAAFEKKAAAGDVKAQYEVGARYAEGFGVKQDASRGFEWLAKAAQRGDIRAEWRVGFMLVNGVGTTADVNHGLEWLTKAAEAGSAGAQSILGQAYLRGTSVPEDDHKAFEWLSKLAQRGAPIPQRQIGSMNAAGKGVPQDWKAAREWWEKAAEQNEAEALYLLAETYFTGHGVEENPKAGISLLVRACCFGNLDAGVLLSRAYVGGAGVPKDLKRGVDLLEAAARAGSGVAETYYGVMFTADASGIRDDSKARIWLTRGAAQGQSVAQKNLGILYDEGRGGDRDPVEALKWFQLAADQGNQEAADRRKEALLFATPAQAQEAKRRAEAFKPEDSRPVPDDAPAAECPLLEGFRIPVKMLGGTNYLVVDTGATLTMLDPTNRPPLGEPLANDKTATAFQQTDIALYDCPEIHIGERRLAPLWTGCASFEKVRMAIGEPLDGILGMLCLRNYVVTFDLDNGRFVLGGAVPEAIKSNASAVPLRKVSTHTSPVIEATINGVGPLYLELDTGDFGWISLCPEDWRSVFPHGEPATVQEYHIGMGEQGEQERAARVRTVSVGTNQYSNLIVSMGKGLLCSYIGRSFLARHTSVIDFPNQVLYLLPGKRFQEPDEEDMSGLHLMRQSGKTVVRLLDKGSPAERAGLKLDDQIVSINGLDAASLKTAAIAELLRSQPGARIEMKAMRGDKLLQFAFVLKRAI